MGVHLLICLVILWTQFNPQPLQVDCNDTIKRLRNICIQITIF